ncbi:MAG: transcriptional regulator [Pyrinomonadaceae bacterium]|nr:transcriptional regulator [Pyrinomonadaceae bacterium]
MILMVASRLYEFGPYRLDPAERRLLRDGKPVALTPKCFDLLVLFVENSGHLLEKGELLERLWPGQFVEEANLSFNISSLRKVLGEGQNGRRFIETVPKKGFRFVERVEERWNRESKSATHPD